VPYRLHLLAKFEHVDNVFHISQLQKYTPDPSNIIEAKPIKVAENLVYNERPMQILDRREKQLCNKSIPLVKVLWVITADLKLLGK